MQINKYIIRIFNADHKYFETIPEIQRYELYFEASMIILLQKLKTELNLNIPLFQFKTRISSLQRF